jgi:hypothetical protein
MVNDADAQLMRRARWAYELSRIRIALFYALPALPLAALSHSCCVESSTLWLLCAAAVTIIAASVWRGRGLGAGARAGLGAGLLSWLLPLAARSMSLAMSTAAIPLCFGAGVASGLLVARQVRHRNDERLSFAIAAAVVAGLIGGLGCVIAGAGGLAGMLAGELLGAAPIVVLARRRA